jgi:hypothetical protein
MGRILLHGSKQNLVAPLLLLRMSPARHRSFPIVEIWLVMLIYQDRQGRIILQVIVLGA